VRAVDLLDILLVAALLWVGLVWLRRSSARYALLGVLVVGLVYAAARRFGLELTAWIFQGATAVFLIFLVVVFQDDLRRLFEQIGTLGWRRRPAPPASGAQQVLVRTVSRLASQRTGALIVVPGREPLDRYLEGGISLDGWISEPLLLSLFDTSSPGHDGAAVVAGNKLLRFAVHLPLSADRAQLGPGGTRHAAALGLAERSDALCVVVSEERGTVSVAREGRLQTLAGPEQLGTHLEDFLARALPTPAGRLAAVRARLPEGAVALAVALSLWLLLGPGGESVEVERDVPVRVENLPEGYALEGVEPESVTVRLEGERRRLVIEDLGSVEVRIDALLAQLGRRTFRVAKDDVVHPDGLEVLDVDPDRVRISVSKPSDAGEGP